MPFFRDNFISDTSQSFCLSASAALFYLLRPHIQFFPLVSCLLPEKIHPCFGLPPALPEYPRKGNRKKDALTFL